MARTARPARPTLVAGGVAASALLLGACAPVTTALNYSPSDGSRVDLDEAGARGLNLMVLAESEGATGEVYGALTNDSADDLDITLTPTGASPVTIPVAAHDTVYLGVEDGVQILLDDVEVIPGANLGATLEAGGESESFFLPVFDATLPEYAEYVP
ncbi:hypothetical protein GCM10023216_04480 [Isoptericola chiayiensis]|uniref:Lipoprotein n=1 Tax=Isoptericola chiayiensis TaxID=579446 RepID=A0ABP8Y379_9MICO|nr:hypothetical protein [Isoptericola chiayiensis]NOV99592.1 hypothetical protein [Isoptericola chiayiensis]